MEKGFNDQELADIMNEIESLEREFAEQPAATAAPVPEAKEVAAPLAEMTPEKAIPKTNHAADANVVPLKAPVPVAPGSSSMSFQVSGQMTVNLCFEVDGQKVNLSVSGEGLNVETESGARFTLPFANAAARRKAS